MTPTDFRLSKLADDAKVRPSHVYHVWAAMADPAFDPVAFAAFARLEVKHIQAIMAALQSSGLVPEKKRRSRVPGTESGPCERATRLAAVMQLPDDWIAFAQEQRRWPRETVEIEFAAFLDYWHAQPGTKGVKLDWFATWRNWCRRSHTPDGSWSPNTGDWTPELQRQKLAEQKEFLARIGRD